MTCSNQGRGCPDCLNASRAALGLSPLEMHRIPGLHTESDSGHSVNAGISFPMEDDKPVAEPYETGLWIINGLAALVFVLFVVMTWVVYPNFPR